MPEYRVNPMLAFAKKLWGPVPWMLELALILELALGKYTEAVIMSTLLLNAVQSYTQEGSAQGVMALLRKQLKINARVTHDRTWKLLMADAHVPEDRIHLRMGDLMPDDDRLKAIRREKGAGAFR